MTNLDIANNYYAAMGNKDLDGMAKYLDPEVELIGPLAEVKGKQDALEAAKKLFYTFNTLNIRAQFEDGDHAMLAIDLHCPVPIGTFKVAVLLSFKQGLICRIELFYDARAFENKEIFSKG